MDNTVIYDGKCRFCRSSVGFLKKLSGEKLKFITFENVYLNCNELKFVFNGRVYGGIEAIFFILYILDKKLPWWLYKNLPPFRFLSIALYRFVARFRRVLDKFIPI